MFNYFKGSKHILICINPPSFGRAVSSYVSPEVSPFLMSVRTCDYSEIWLPESSGGGGGAYGLMLSLPFLAGKHDQIVGSILKQGG